ncbi:MAG: DUF5110 domain-containing protein [Bacteroidaceae bacterium]|nr:DUF5110 domain-containing protein [Bacteroidaceae bacterium]
MKRNLTGLVATFLLVTNVLAADQFSVTPLAPNAVRIRYAVPGTTASDLPDWLYVTSGPVKHCDLRVTTDVQQGSLTIRDRKGRVVFEATSHQTGLTFRTPADDHLYGLGQFQDGFSDIRGLTRRLTQVNTQISIPVLISNKGYGLLWNNYGMVDYNPAENALPLTANGEGGEREVVNITTTAGGRREERVRGAFSAQFTVPADGQYALLLDVGQKMARRHHLVIDGETILDARNLWLPPTASAIVTLQAGTHNVTAQLEAHDRPVLHWRAIDETTTLRSPDNNIVDYTVFVGSPDEILSTLHDLTGHSPMLPRWAFGYIHCRERFHSSDEILQTARRFRSEGMPLSVIVQDWQWWGKYGWNAMQFDEQYYPDPRALTDSLHAMDVRLMLSVWSKIDVNSEVGRQMSAGGHYIPGTDWIDFFSPEAAAAYWKNFSQRLVPQGIDAWWQDATEPENDDLAGRRVNSGKWAGEQVRNVYPLLVNKTVYEGLRADRPTSRPMILTRSGFPGIQRYGSAMWSGDVGNDWQTLATQITAGLGMMAAGQPWWTYDAGGFFRPGDQYTNQDYIRRMLRWIQVATYLPFMRVHGYQSDTEPWRYGDAAQHIIVRCLRERERLLPYIYTCAAAVSERGQMLMRPLVFDFSTDEEALRQKTEYMFGPALLVCPVTAPDVTSWRVYLPPTPGGWYQWNVLNAQPFDGGRYADVPVTDAEIPVFARAGSIIPLAGDTLALVPGADAAFTLYEDDGTTTAYEQGQASRITFRWDNNRHRFSIDARRGSFPAMVPSRQFTVILPDGTTTVIPYNGRKVSRCL